MTVRRSDILGSSGWFQSSRVRLLEYDVAIHSDHPAVIDLIDELYEPLAVPGPARSALMIGAATYRGEPGYFTALDGEILVRSTAPSIAFAHLLFEANQQAIERSRGLIRLHAAAVTCEGRAIALPGPMGTGKSTLAAALVRRGLGYVTDEVVAIDPVTGRVRSYAKPVSLGVVPAALGPVSWVPPRGSEPFLGSAAVFPAPVLGSWETTSPALSTIVMPRYVEGAPTLIERVGAADALSQLAAHTFHLDEPGTLATLAGVVGNVPTFTLTSGDLNGAVEAVLSVVDAVAAS